MNTAAATTAHRPECNECGYNGEVVPASYALELTRPVPGETGLTANVCDTHLEILTEDGIVAAATIIR